MIQVLRFSEQVRLYAIRFIISIIGYTDDTACQVSNSGVDCRL